MSYKLEYPYTEEQRANFIVEYNHNQCLRIEEVDNFVDVEVPIENEDGETTTEIQNVNMPTLYALEPFEEFVNGEVIENSDYAQQQAQLKAKELVQKLYDIKAEKAYGGVIINYQLVFETNQVSITNTVASLALMDDTGTSAWKFYTIDGQPTTQQITKIQLLGIAKFGQDMINKAFEVEGNFNTALALATVEELNNSEWCELFIQEAQEAMDLVNNVLVVNFENTTPDEGSETNSGNSVESEIE